MLSVVDLSVIADFMSVVMEYETLANPPPSRPIASGAAFFYANQDAPISLLETPSVCGPLCTRLRSRHDVSIRLGVFPEFFSV